MVTPLSLITRIARPVRTAPALGRCPVCRQNVHGDSEALTLRGGLVVHRSCATYRVRQRARRR
jgi:hypothetical protein